MKKTLLLRFIAIVAVIFTLQLLSCQDREFDSDVPQPDKIGSENIELAMFQNGITLEEIDGQYVYQGDVNTINTMSTYSEMFTLIGATRINRDESSTYIVRYTPQNGVPIISQIYIFAGEPNDGLQVISRNNLSINILGSRLVKY